jgi:hypothetical protein
MDSRYLTTGVVFMFFFMLVVTGSALSVSVQPEYIYQGDRVTIDIQGLTDGSSFSLLLEGRLTPAGDHFLFRTTQFVMPLTLYGGQISAYAANTTGAGISVKKGTSTVSISGLATNGIFQTTEAHEINEGTYDYLQIEGDRTPGASLVTTRLSLTGVKEGPDTSQLSFVMDGIEPGIIEVQIAVNGSGVVHQTLTVVSPVSSLTDSASDGTVTVTPVAPISSRNTTSGSHRIRSLDGRVEINTDASVEILPRDDERTEAQGWRLVYSPYEVLPADGLFDPPAVLSFMLPDDIDTPVFLARDENGNWRILPSRIDGGLISAEIRLAGIYGLMTLEGSSTNSLEGATPVSAPAQTQTTPALAPPLAVLIVILALAACGGTRSRRG